MLTSKPMPRARSTAFRSGTRGSIGTGPPPRSSAAASVIHTPSSHGTGRSGARGLTKRSGKPVSRPE